MQHRAITRGFAIGSSVTSARSRTQMGFAIGTDTANTISTTYVAGSRGLSTSAMMFSIVAPSSQPSVVATRGPIQAKETS